MRGIDSKQTKRGAYLRPLMRAHNYLLQWLKKHKNLRGEPKRVNKRVYRLNKKLLLIIKEAYEEVPANVKEYVELLPGDLAKGYIGIINQRHLKYYPKLISNRPGRVGRSFIVLNDAIDTHYGVVFENHQHGWVKKDHCHSPPILQLKALLKRWDDYSLTIHPQAQIDRLNALKRK